MWLMARTWRLHRAATALLLPRGFTESKSLVEFGSHFLLSAVLGAPRWDNIWLQPGPKKN